MMLGFLFIGCLSYAISIFIDVFVWHFRFYTFHEANNRYLVSMSNILQYSARAFILLFGPIMAYYTEKFNDVSLIFWSTVVSHIIVIILVLITLNATFCSKLSSILLKILNFHKVPLDEKMVKVNILKAEAEVLDFNFTKYKLLTVACTAASFFFAVGGSLIYYLSFYFPKRVLFMTTQAQIINMFGTLLFVLLIDPTISKKMDINKGYAEIRVYTYARIIAHILLISSLIFFYSK